MISVKIWGFTHGSSLSFDDDFTCLESMSEFQRCVRCYKDSSQAQTRQPKPVSVRSVFSPLHLWNSFTMYTGWSQAHSNSPASAIPNPFSFFTFCILKFCYSCLSRGLCLPERCTLCRPPSPGAPSSWNPVCLLCHCGFLLYQQHGIVSHAPHCSLSSLHEESISINT